MIQTVRTLTIDQTRMTLGWDVLTAFLEMALDHDTHDVLSRLTRRQLSRNIFGHSHLTRKLFL